jgi:dihydroflavonol-4-reductase
MKVLVTGSDGLLGSHIVRELLSDGYTVRALVLPNSSSKTLDGLDVERIRGNICNPDDIITAIRGCDMVIHAAASTKVWPTRSSDIWHTNLIGTQNVVEAALENNIQRLVYVSTASAFHSGSKENPGTENDPFDGYRYRLDYIDSKYAAHEYVLQATRERGLPAILINPTFMFGEYDSLPSSGKMIVAVYRGGLPGYTNGGKNFVYAKDVARACVNALKMGRIGECYIAGNQNLSYREVFQIMAKVMGVKAPKLKLPQALIMAYGYLGTFFGKLLHLIPNISHATARVSCDGQYYSPKKAVEELKMPQTPLEKAILNAFNWLKKYHYC